MSLSYYFFSCICSMLVIWLNGLMELESWEKISKFSVIQENSLVNMHLIGGCFEGDTMASAQDGSQRKYIWTRRVLWILFPCSLGALTSDAGASWWKEEGESLLPSLAALFDSQYQEMQWTYGLVAQWKQVFRLPEVLGAFVSVNSRICQFSDISIN